MIADMNYKVSFNVDRPTDSTIKIGPSPDSDQYGKMDIVANDTEGNKEFVFTAPVTGVAFLTLTTTGNGFTYWDNISVVTIPNLSSDEYLLLARSMNVFGIPVGGEERWRVQHLDKENIDYFGMPVAGMRTIESYGESIIEDYYDLQKRQTDILNPPIRINSLSVVTGIRNVVSLSPFCSAHLQSEWGTLLPQFTTSAQCAEPNGEWIATVGESCSNVIYTNEVDCTEPNGTWTAGLCSGGNYQDESVCLGSGTCSDPSLNNNEIGCLGAGTCSDPLFYDQTACTAAGGTWTSAGNSWTNDGYTWLPGSCSNQSFTDQPTCEAARAIWTPEVTEHCTESAFATQSYCEAQRGVWNMVDVTAIAGSVIELTGEGIDLDWTITIGGIEQITSAVLLPTRVNFTVTEETPLLEQEFTIINTAGDYFIYPDPFVVTQYMRIVTVYQPSPFVNSVGEVSSSAIGGFGGGEQSLYYGNGEAQFKIFGFGFDSACTVSVKKSSATEHPQNYLAGGNNNQTFSNPPSYAGDSGITSTWVSAGEIHCMVTVNDIPAGHGINVGGDKFGVMYYNVTVTNPDGESFTEVASAIPGSPSEGWLTNFPEGHYTGDNATGEGSWNASDYEAGHGIRIWGYVLPLE
jgi:hypothetical protein